MPANGASRVKPRSKSPSERSKEAARWASGPYGSIKLATRHMSHVSLFL
jgi:hypothetical protein